MTEGYYSPSFVDGFRRVPLGLLNPGLRDGHYPIILEKAESSTELKVESKPSPDLRLNLGAKAIRSAVFETDPTLPLPETLVVYL